VKGGTRKRFWRNRKDRGVEISPKRSRTLGRDVDTGRTAAVQIEEEFESRLDEELGRLQAELMRWNPQPHWQTLTGAAG
jgi:hypothetical protein